MVNIQREYVAGACNISPEEEAHRWTAGWVGVLLTGALAAALWALGWPVWWRLVLFLPATLAATGFLQAGLHFCANYGLRGVFNVGSAPGKVSAVADPEAARKDRQRARAILAGAVLVGVVVTALSFLLPWG